MFVIRLLDDGTGAEWGARGYGPHGDQAARQIVEQIQQRNTAAGPDTTPTFSYLPHPAEPQPTKGCTAILHRRHGSLLIHWPTSQPAAAGSTSSASQGRPA